MHTHMNRHNSYLLVRLAFLWLYCVLQFIYVRSSFLWLFYVIVYLCMCIFVVLHSVLLLCQEIGRKERLRNALFYVEWDPKAELSQSVFFAVTEFLCVCMWSLVFCMCGLMICATEHQCADQSVLRVLSDISWSSCRDWRRHWHCVQLLWCDLESPKNGNFQSMSLVVIWTNEVRCFHLSSLFCFLCRWGLHFCMLLKNAVIRLDAGCPTN